MNRLLLLCALLLLGCDRPRLTPPVGITLTSAQVDQVFEREEIFGYSLHADRSYAVPSLEWFEREFPVEWQRFSGAIMGRYAAEARDCDDFARAGAFFAQLLHSRSLRSTGTALAVGEFWYETARGNHALVAAICQPEGTTNLVVAFFEPQPGRLVRLSAQEYRSCWARRF